jgi:zinc protease
MIRAMFISALLLVAAPARGEVQAIEVTSPSGIKAWLLEDHTIPFTALQIWFAGGTSLDRAEGRGAVNLMTALIEEGAGEMDAQAFARARDDLAAQFSFSAGRDGINVSAQFLTENRDAALSLLGTALQSPRFDQNAIDRVRAQVLAGIEADAKDPSSIASDVSSAAIFGAHPYGSNDSGTVDSVTALTRDDIVAAFRGAIARDRMIIAAAGDITAAELGAALDGLLGNLPATGAPLPPRAQPQFSGGVTVQDFPGPQSTVLFAQNGIAVRDPDFMAATVVNEILGGDRFTARLMTEIRDKRGLTYGIGTDLASMQLAETMQGGFQASNEKVAEAVDVLRAQWAALAAGNITQAELDAAKTFMIGAYPLRWDGNGAIASILVGMQINGFPIDYPKFRNDLVRALTLEDVNRVARRLLTPDALQITVVGQPNPAPK